MASPSKSPKRRPAPDEFLKLPDRVREAMDVRGFGGRGGQTRLAKKSGVSGGHLSAVLDGERLGGIQAALVIHLARALEVNAGWLLTGHGDMDGTAAPVITQKALGELLAAAVEAGVDRALKKP